ncbi:hypothetical protein E4U42_007501 [Claviceps africana]|uniref:Conserved oligomeric Golgi complex subunit 8 n=1 Tax=Claviceps africana TaxID=83212 RepID=A0A8K0J127_9HYPO|nr:hypothetical protein E4U42_007501 [Claviceps africana]
MAQVLAEQLLGPGHAADETIVAYLEQLADLKVEAVQNSEPYALSQASHSLLLNIQALSKKSHRRLVESAASHASLRQTLPRLARRASDLNQMVPRLDEQAELFSTEFNKAKDMRENTIIADRKRALRLLSNSERLVNVMEIPPLLHSAISSSPVNHSSFLDLYAHVQRLASLHASSPLVASVKHEADAAVRQLAADLIATLKVANLKLASSLRTVGWLKRIVPDLISHATEEALSATFLVCRLSTLLVTLDALSPLRDLADQESSRNVESTQGWAGGQHTERYLKRFIEVFREHSFGIVSVASSVDASFPRPADPKADLMYPLPSVLASFPLHLIGILTETLQMYLPNLRDSSTRESILTQVLYCAGSLGRLGADFGALLSSVGTHEWIDLVKKHRLLAGRLESVIGDYRDRGR